MPIQEKTGSAKQGPAVPYRITSVGPRSQPRFFIVETSSGSSGSSYTPTSAGTLSVWLDASATSTLTLSGNSVTAWADKSTNAYSAIINNSLGYPTYVAASGGTPPYLNFNPSQGLRIPVRPYKTSWTLFVAINSVSLGSRWLISHYDSFDLVMMGMNTSGMKIYNGFLTGASDATGNHIEMTTAQDTSTTGLFAWYRDGTQQLTNTTNANKGAFPGAGLGIGANQSGNYDVGGQYQIYEILLYDTFINTTQRQQVEGYLGWKWGLQGNLPSGHPYKNAAP